MTGATTNCRRPLEGGNLGNNPWVERQAQEVCWLWHGLHSPGQVHKPKTIGSVGRS